MECTGPHQVRRDKTAVKEHRKKDKKADHIPERQFPDRQCVSCHGTKQQVDRRSYNGHKNRHPVGPEDRLPVCQNILVCREAEFFRPEGITVI